MAAGSVSFTFDDGDAVSVPQGDLRRVYDALWDLAKGPGAVSTAALLMDAWRLHPFVRKPIALTTSQSAVLRRALSLVGISRAHLLDVRPCG
jgi:hypothetical protein